jgi:uncharacterized damage-inducible protein DinB
MKIDIGSIKNPPVRTFYMLYWPQHQAIIDFYERLMEEQFSFRMVDSPERKADTPRESLAHILYVQWVYFDSVKTGKLEFRSMGTEHYSQMTKAQLIAELERIDTEMVTFLTAESFDSGRLVKTFWGAEMNCIDVLFFLRDHDILHIGWNLALMDHLNIPRYDSLIQYWG